MGGRGGEAGVGRTDGSPRATGYTLGSPTPEVTRSGGGGLSRPPHPPLTSGSSFFLVFFVDAAPAICRLGLMRGRRWPEVTLTRLRGGVFSVCRRRVDLIWREGVPLTSA